MPGNLALDWITNIKAAYTAYDTAKAKYDTDAAAWKTWTEYKPPAPGMFDGIFGTTEDPNKPTVVQ